MITIPKDVKKKLKEYVGYKNVRVHFPNGEREDITNDNIVDESLELQESLCSKTNIQFGLCEANSVKFECFGIDNIDGAIIEVTLEVYLDNEEMYSIPYGIYKVHSSKRQADINRRKVIAYDAIKSSTLDSYIGELINDEIRNTEPFRAPSIYQFEKNFFREYGLTKRESKKESVVWIQSAINGATLFTGETSEIYVYEHSYDFIATSFEDNSNEYFKVYFSKEINEKRKNEIKNYLDEPKVNLIGSVSEWLETLCTLWINEADGTSKEITEMETDEYTNISSAHLRVVDSVEVRSGTTSEYKVVKKFEFGYQDAIDAAKVNRILLSDIEKRRVTKEVEKTTARSLLSSLYELNGTFGRINREDGYIEDVELGNGSLYPEDTLYPADDLYPSGSKEVYRRGNYETLTFEEFETEPFKAIYATYRDENGNESEITYNFAETGQTYSMTNNWILKNLFLKKEEVEEILERMAEKIKDITFVPFKMKASGMPYLEAGDMIEISTEEKTIRSYILKRKISGIQLLGDSIEAN